MRGVDGDVVHLIEVGRSKVSRVLQGLAIGSQFGQKRVPADRGTIEGARIPGIVTVLSGVHRREISRVGFSSDIHRAGFVSRNVVDLLVAAAAK